MASTRREGLARRTFSSYFAFQPPAQLKEELTTVKTIRDRIVSKTHIDLDPYFRSRNPAYTSREGKVPQLSLPCSPLRARNSSHSPSPIPSKSSVRYEQFPDCDLMNARAISKAQLPKRVRVVKALRNMQTFLPPVKKTEGYRDRLIRDSLQLIEMRRKLNSYMLKGEAASYKYYKSKKL